jgi:hypothetical protein
VAAVPSGLSPTPLIIIIIIIIIIYEKCALFACFDCNKNQGKLFMLNPVFKRHGSCADKHSWTADISSENNYARRG